MGFSSTSIKPGQPDLCQNKASLWQEHIEGWETSGLTQGIYCQRHAISLASFGYWRTRLKRMQPDKKGREIEARFLPVQLMSTQHDPLLTLRTPQNVSIDVSGGFDPQLLKEVLQVLVTI
jgi:transposase